jgi:hypothetical protein
MQYINGFTGGYYNLCICNIEMVLLAVIITSFCTEKANLGYFWLKTGLAPQPFNFCSCMLSSSRAAE